ncbi:MAG: hypothetical protein CMJ41_00075 [Phycisphaerae bacterium]|nr:hypothetical protein [Phycisphaerae bacterium]|tara:strand:- start:6597 stop:7505 length:909 start_codon:yes stop_codon:yes gene_type:complete
MSDPQGYYATLEVEPGASGDAIKKAYRRLSLLTHPDRTNEDTKAKFQAISEAYNVLGDEENRKLYDRGGSGGIHFPADGIPVNPQDIFDFFRNNMPPPFGGEVPGMQTQFFHMDGNGKMNFHEAMQRPTPIIKTINITLAQAFTGCKVPVEIERWVCEGSIKQKESETIYVSVPEGIDENEIIVLRDKGNVLSETNKGHIKIFIKVSNNTDLVRRGLDLVYQKVITLKEALCGFTFDLDYLDERIFKVDNHNGNVISPGYKKVIQGLGMKRDGHKGNLIIEFTVTFPERLTKEQISSIEQHL